MPDQPAILLLDEDDLKEVAALLTELGVDYQHICVGKQRGALPDPGKLLITTSRLAMTLNCRRGPKTEPRRAMWIAFLSGESRTQRQVLERAGFDFMVRQPVHPAALRLLLQRALYEGDESRRSERVAFGYEVGVKLGMRSHKATLTDLSPGGCRLLFGRELEKRQKLLVRIPAEAAGGRRLDLSGTVVRTGRAELEGGSPGDGVYGIRFEPLSKDTRDRLRELLLAHTSGPAVLPGPHKAPVAAKAAREESRAHPRRSFAMKVTAIGGDARAETHHVLLGRDISLGGMCVEPEPSLSVDDEIRLAIQPSGCDDPVLVEATVLRNEGQSGLALRFDWIDPQAQARLAELIAALPVIESLGTEAPGRTVLTRMLSSFRPR